VVKLEDTLDLGSSAERREGSNPSPGTDCVESYVRVLKEDSDSSFMFIHFCDTYIDNSGAKLRTFRDVFDYPSRDTGGIFYQCEYCAYVISIERIRAEIVKLKFLKKKIALVAELAYAPVSRTGGETHEGSTPSRSTIIRK
jgi:hypothetical protein